LHDDSDSLSKFSQDSDADIFYSIDSDAEICATDLRDSYSNSDDGQASAYVDGDDGGNDHGDGVYNDKDDDNGDMALWDKNDHDFYTIPFHASSDYKPPQNRKMSV
jgi:hypothetical protein